MSKNNGCDCHKVHRKIAAVLSVNNISPEDGAEILLDIVSRLVEVEGISKIDFNQGNVHISVRATEPPAKKETVKNNVIPIH
jgi:hypothetical protein